ncbi:DUF418 domain-containing protein [Shewanella abyssi]|uniref:DUF418 domain-containing protein n=1 Tax=Shewanella abyssi TaxID=311789 RepID=UPI00200C1D20|nr:DUF418 domain-containing protein [Shewanella abyssi]MCL1050042.1 DUF418 domain-containing protein [Shewanella abyssi]
MEPLTNSVSNNPNPNTFTRNANIDAIRGLALLGILFMNIYFFGNSFLGYANHEMIPLHDTLTLLFSNVFLEGRFISLFSMLFGVGLAIQYDRFANRSDNPYKSVKSRLKWLLLFGAIHAIFIWYGDILFTYALGGFVALCYLKLDNAKLIKKSLWFIIVPLLIFAVISLFVPEEPVIRGSPQFKEELLIWTGAYSEQVMMQLIIFTAMVFTAVLVTMWMSAGLMMLGVALYRKGTFENGFSNKALLQFAFATLLLSTVDSLLTLADKPMLTSLSATVVIFSAIPMALIYIHLLVKICQNRATVLAPLQKVGRLTFSLYILQSVCGVLLFRYIAPTLTMTLDRPDYMLIAIGFSIFQVILASVYLRYFNQGPLETLWRWLAKPKASKLESNTIDEAAA